MEQFHAEKGARPLTQWSTSRLTGALAVDEEGGGGATEEAMSITK